MALSLWCGAWPFLLEVRAGPRVSGPSVFVMLVVGPSFLGLGFAFPSSSGVGPSFLGCGGRPFLLEVRAGPPFSGPSVFLMLVVGPSFLGLGFAFPCWSGVGPSFLACAALALPSRNMLAHHSRGWGWPVLLRVGIGPVSLEWGLALPSGPPFSGPSVFLMLVVGPSFSGLGFGLSVFEWGWPFLLGVRVLAFPSRG